MTTSKNWRAVQDIRTSERRFYQKITDIYATSIDYDPALEISFRFFQTVQNKVHWAITGQTAAEIVHARVDAARPNLGLTNWRGATIRRQDVVVAKNFLTEPELAALNNLVEQYLIFAQGQAMRRLPMHMADWITKLNAFLTLNQRDILTRRADLARHGSGQSRAAIRHIQGPHLYRRPTVDADFDRPRICCRRCEAEETRAPEAMNEAETASTLSALAAARRASSRAAILRSIPSRRAVSKATVGAANHSSPITCWCIATTSWP